MATLALECVARERMCENKMNYNGAWLIMLPFIMLFVYKALID